MESKRFPTKFLLWMFLSICCPGASWTGQVDYEKDKTIEIIKIMERIAMIEAEMETKNRRIAVLEAAMTAKDLQLSELQQELKSLSKRINVTEETRRLTSN